MCKRHNSIYNFVMQVRNVSMPNLLNGSSGVLHTKFFVVDSNNFYVGSANFDWRSLTQVFAFNVSYFIMNFDFCSNSQTCFLVFPFSFEIWKSKLSDSFYSSSEFSYRKTGSNQQISRSYGHKPIKFLCFLNIIWFQFTSSYTLFDNL